MENKKIIKFEIVTPEKHIMKEYVKQVTIPTLEGDLTILPKHTPLVATLRSGVLEMTKEDEGSEVAFVSGGFLEVLRDKVVVLADVAERAEEIDESKVEEARAKAEREMAEIRAEDTERFANISAQIERELARTKALRRWKHLKNIK
ncbi:ATP synthase F1 subunit epsilon [Candidatus Falkowbacteria bacterium]|nr:ATP synthase F1 subunit epsilon [Candidatus Falkowbacteria bacterium]